MNDYGLAIIERNLKSKLNDELIRVGILFRLYSRIKDANSISEKMEKKNYATSGRLMQDIIGFRITTYFVDDVKIVVNLCKAMFETVELVYDKPDTDVFKPLRKNMVCKLPAEEAEMFFETKSVNEYLAYSDTTFEIQFRTTLSEGWHEVDHNLRYKKENDWHELQNESRMLNGIYATLETSDQALKALFEDIAYHHYKKKAWEAMIQNKFRLRFKLEPLKDEIKKVFNSNPSVAKTVFKLGRNKTIETLITLGISMPMTLNNLVYFINYFFLKDENIQEMIPAILIEEFELSEEKLNAKLSLVAEAN